MSSDSACNTAWPRREPSQETQAVEAVECVTNGVN